MFDVVIPLYNKSDSIERCLRSLESQTVSVSTVIIVNDGSTDHSLKKAERFIDGSQLNFSVLNQENRGVSAARNSGISKSTTDFVCFLDADDEWHPDFVMLMRDLIADFPGAELYCLGHVVSESGVIYKPKHGCGEGFRGYVQNFFITSARGSVANSSKVAVKRTSIQLLNGFSESVTVGEDLFLWIQLAILGEVVCDSTSAVTVYREYDVHRVARHSSVPYPLEYFGRHRKEIKQVVGLKSYLVRMGVLHVMGASMERDFLGGWRRLSALFRISPLWGVLSLPILCIPAKILRYAKKKRMK